MIGFILTGHGDFAKGLYGSLCMIAGEQEQFEVVPFLEGMDPAAFEQKMSETVADLRKKNDGVVIFSDLLGGSPFRTAMLAAAKVENTAVLVGSNLPMLIEMTMNRMDATDAAAFADEAVAVGKGGIEHPVLSTKERDEAPSDDGGI